MLCPVPLTILKSMYISTVFRSPSTSKTLTPPLVMPKAYRMSLVSDVMMPLTISFILTKVAWFFCMCPHVNQVFRRSSHRVIRGPSESFADCPTFCTKFLTWKPVLSPPPTYNVFSSTYLLNIPWLHQVDQSFCTILAVTRSLFLRPTFLPALLQSPSHLLDSFAVLLVFRPNGLKIYDFCLFILSSFASCSVVSFCFVCTVLL